MTHPNPLHAPLHAREIDYLKSAARKCGLSYRSACRRNSGIEMAKELQRRGLLFLHDKGENVHLSRFSFRITDAGRRALEGVE